MLDASALEQHWQRAHVVGAEHDVHPRRAVDDLATILLVRHPPTAICMPGLAAFQPEHQLP